MAESSVAVLIQNYLNSSVFLLNACRKPNCGYNEINSQFVPSATATLFYSDASRAYFITAAHALWPNEDGKAPHGCHPFTAPLPDSESGKAYFLSRRITYDRNYREYGNAVSIFNEQFGLIEIVIRVQLASIQLRSCDQHYKRIPGSSIFDAAVLQTAPAAPDDPVAWIYSYDKNGERIGAEDIDLVTLNELLGDERVRHPLVSMNRMPGSLPSVVDRLDYGYFAGYPIISGGRDKQKRDIYRVHFERLETPIIIDRTNAFSLLPKAEDRTRQSVAGVSGASLHSFDSGRLHIVGVYRGECRVEINRDICGGRRDHNLLAFTNLADRRIWPIFIGLGVNEEVEALTKKILGEDDQAFQISEDFIRLIRMTDLELLWLAMRILKLGETIGESDSRSLLYHFINERTDKAFRRQYVGNNCNDADWFGVLGDEIQSVYELRGYSRIAEVIEHCTDSSGKTLSSDASNWNDESLRPALVQYAKFTSAMPGYAESRIRAAAVTGQFDALTLAAAAQKAQARGLKREAALLAGALKHNAGNHLPASLLLSYVKSGGDGLKPGFAKPVGPAEEYGAVFRSLNRVSGAVSHQHAGPAAHNHRAPAGQSFPGHD